MSGKAVPSSGTASYGKTLHLRTGGPTVSYSDVKGGWAGTGNINQDPMLTDTTCYLQSGSPCIDAGDSTKMYNDMEDPSSPGVARLPSMGGLRNDMGAYGGFGACELPRFDQPTEVASSKSIRPSKFHLEQNYPNPFNPSTMIIYSIPSGCRVSLKMIDVLGREIERLVDEYQDPGQYQIRFNGLHLASRIYFLRLQAGDLVDTKKCVFIK
jgi:hypothetical protein